MSYKEKYLKYKQKYLQLKKMVGGDDEDVERINRMENIPYNILNSFSDPYTQLNTRENIEKVYLVAVEKTIKDVSQNKGDELLIALKKLEEAKDYLLENLSRQSSSASSSRSSTNVSSTPPIQSISTMELQELKTEYPRLDPTEYAGRWIRFNVIGDGRCGFYAALLSTFALLYPTHQDNEIVQYILRNGLSVESVSEFMKRRVNWESLRSSLREIGDFKELRRINQEIGFIQNGQTDGFFSIITINHFISQICPNLMVIGVTDAMIARGIITQPDPGKTAVYIYQRSGHFQALVSVDKARLLLTNREMQRVFKSHNDARDRIFSRNRIFTEKTSGKQSLSSQEKKDIRDALQKSMVDVRKQSRQVEQDIDLETAIQNSMRDVIPEYEKQSTQQYKKQPDSREYDNYESYDSVFNRLVSGELNPNVFLEVKDFLGFSSEEIQSLENLCENIRMSNETEQIFNKLLDEIFYNKSLKNPNDPRIQLLNSEQRSGLKNFEIIMNT